jgi:hypothetical protein
MQYAHEHFGLSIVYRFVHLHTTPDETLGHLMVRVYDEVPTRVEVESQALDTETREFLAELPRAARR